MFKYIGIAILLLFATFCFSQTSITGTITDGNEPIIGSTIYNETQGKGTISDVEGNFDIIANKGDKITVSFLGYEDVFFTTDHRIQYNIFLAQKTAALDEILVTALGLKREAKALGYSIQSISSKEISEVKSVNFLDNLSGKLAGVTISQGATGVGSTSKIVIRGESSFTSNNPLFIVDGIPINNSTNLNVTNEQAAGFQEIDFGNGAMDVNPDDIASVSVLKGPSAAALYGARASNGVIVITTKDGSNSEGLGISFNTSFFLETPFQLPQFQNKYGQGNSGEFEFVNGLGGGTNDVITYSYGPELDKGTNITQFDSPVTLPDGTIVRGGDVAVHGGLPITPTPFVSHPDNLKNFYEVGSTKINNLSFSGNNEKANYRLSLTNLKSDSYIPGVNLDRNTLSGRMNFKPTNRITINTSFNYINTSSDNRPASGYGSENINYSLVAWMGRQTNMESLKKYWQPGLEGLQQYSFNYTYFDNPYFILLENKNGFNRNRIFGNISASYQLTNELSATVRTGLDNSAELRTFRRNFSSNRFINGAYAEHDINFREVNTDFLLTYTKKFGNIGFDIAAGGNRMDQTSTNKQAQAIGLAQPGVFKLTNAASPIELFQYDFNKRINSFYGIAKLSFKEYLYVDVTGRNDWSSALATSLSTKNTSFFYPSVSASFILSKVVNLPKSVSFAKLRASWAQVGNDTDPYQTVGVYSAQTPYNAQPTFSDQTLIANSNLLPESSTAIELGADFRFFDDRLNLDLTYYNALNENQIISLPIAVSTGYNQRVVNGGAVRSKGVEFVLRANPFRSKNFDWQTFVNFSRNVSKAESLPGGAGSLTLAYSRVYDNPNQSVYFIVREGDRIGDIWGTGYAKNEKGEFIITDKGLLTVDNTLKKLGNYNPDFIVGFGNDVSYKNWNLNFLIDWRQGGQIVSRTQALAGVAGQLKETEYRPSTNLIFEGVTAAGTPNTIAITPEQYYRQYYDRNHEENNTFDATYVKLRQVQLGYSFGKAQLKGSFLKTLNGLDISLIGRNLFAISDIVHFDPEQIAVQGNTFVSGVEDMSYPTARSIGVSLSVKL